jgi:hypothetical protein
MTHLQIYRNSSKVNFTPLESENIFILGKGGVELILDEFVQLDESVPARSLLGAAELLVCDTASLLMEMSHPWSADKLPLAAPLT